MADIQRYLKLITSEHQNKPKFTAWLTSILTPLDDIATLANNLHLYFDVDTAVGVQLDTIGDIVGVKRTVNFQPTPFYSIGVTGVSYIVNPSPILEDEVYRLVLRAKILKNMWDGTLPSLYDMWDLLFQDSYIIIKDNQDMSMNAFVIGLSSQIHKDLTTNGYIIPKPQGIMINYTYSSVPLFAFGVEQTDLQGFGEGTWSQNF